MSAQTFEIRSLSVKNPPVKNGPTDTLAEMTIQIDPFLFVGARLIRWTDTGMLKLVLPGSRRDCRVVVLNSNYRDILLRHVLAAVRLSAETPPATALSGGVANNVNS